MASAKTKFAVGVFVAIGFFIGTLAVVWLGMSRFFEKGQYRAAYFDQSVQGLSKDSPVKYRGVTIGRVHRVAVAPDETMIEVVVKIETGLGSMENMVAQIKSVGITGIMFIELDQKDPAEPDRTPRITFPTEYPILATKPSEIERIMQGVDDLMAQIRSLQLGRIGAKLQQVLDRIDTGVQDLQLKTVSEELRLALGQLRQILVPERWQRAITRVEAAGVAIADAAGTFREAGGHYITLAGKLETSADALPDLLTAAERLVDETEHELKTTLSEARAAMVELRRLMQSGSLLVDNTDERLQMLALTLQALLGRIEKTAETVNRLLESVADQPSRLIFGEPAPPRRLPGGP
jgi:phospholipid/cholesterol/gamma-HCH transport system substrate-binding protein